MILLENLNKTYLHRGRKIDALRDVSLHVRAGEIFGVIGQSGAGKSTLIRCVNLLEKPDSGRVVVNKQCLTELSHAELLKARHGIGMIFQHFNLLSSRTVYANVALPLELIGMGRAAIKKRVYPLLELTGLSDKARYYPAQLSGGQKQRVAIARALASEANVLLSDEATSALDPHTTESILQLLKEINRRLNVTVLLITHEMDVVKQICDRVALIENGALVEVGAVEQFFTAPQSELGRHFIQQSLRFELPDFIRDTLQDEPNHRPVVLLSFIGDEVTEPVISSVSRHFQVDVNIMQAKIEHIKQTSLGLLIAELNGSEQAVKEALQHLHSLPVRTKVLGYVRDSD